jgi:arylsulfatase A-like enzyme
MKFTLSLLLPLLLCAIAPLAGISFPADRPNILLLLSDDHSYPFVSAYGDTNVNTPTLDRLAAEGIKLRRFFTACPQCVPSRAAYMTGRSPVAARMTRFSSPLARDEITFPELLRDKAGYFTGVCGRTYHLDGAAPARVDNAIAKFYNEHHLRTFADRVDFLNTCPDDQVATQVAAFLDKWQGDKKPADKPFFLWANFSDPHHPWNTPAEFRPDPAKLKLPAHWPDLPGVREQVADYCGEVNRVDRTIAGVLEVLQKRGLYDKTLIVFAGDNGQALPHGKGSLYDPGSNVPLLIRWPGVIKPGGDSRELLSNEDIGPTLLAAAGLSPGDKMSGVSFLPLLKGEPHTPRKYVFVERGPHGSAPVSVNMTNAGFDLSRAVRSDRYKFIYNCTPWIPYAPVDSAGGPGWTQMKAANADGTLSAALRTTYFTTPRPVYELYDLEADPSELKNLSGQPELAATEHELRLALAEKMILDFDYLPLPALLSDNNAADATPKQKAGKKGKAAKK